MKYGYIVYYYCKRKFIYKAEMIMKSISLVIQLLIVCSIWGVLLSDNPEKMSSTILYLVIINMLNQVMAINIDKDIGYSITDGSIALNMIRPIPYPQYLFFCKLGELLPNFILVIVSVFIFWNSEIVKIKTVHLSMSLLISVICSFVLIYLFEFMIGLIGFFTTQIFGVTLLKSTLINLIIGTVVPTELYPKALQAVITNLPFHAMYQAPVRICMKTVYKKNIYQTILVELGITEMTILNISEQLFWIVFLGVLTIGIWAKAKSRIEIQGG